MVDQARALVDKQVRRVQRRLFFQVVIHSVVVCWAIGLLAAMAWFLLRPFTFAEAGDAVRWSVPAIALGLSTIAGLVLAWIRRPDLVTSSLALDERFKLQERVTTFLTLSNEQIDTPAGQALLKDVTAHLSSLQVGSEFPLRLAWRDLLMPAGALALALLACVLDPVLGDLKFGSTINADEPKRVAEMKEIQQQLDEIKKNVNQRKDEQKATSEELKKMEEEFAKLLNQPLEKNEEKIRERLNEMQNLADKIKERAEALKEKAEKTDALKKHLEKLGLDKDRAAKEGPAKDFEDALRKGDLEKAKAALEKLVKDMKENKLDAKQQKEIAEQFKKLQKELKKVMDEDQFMKKLKQDLKERKITKEDFEREVANFKHLEDLADILGQCEECLEKGDGKRGAGELDKLMKRFEEMELNDKEINELLRDQKEIEDALRLLRAGVGDEGGDMPGGLRDADPNDPNTKPMDERTRANNDPKGSQRITGFARGGSFSKIPAQAVQGAFKQAAQESPEALDRQRIPDDAAPITRGYFQKLGNQK